MKPEEAVAIAKMSDTEMIAAQQVYNAVVSFFHGNNDKANIWFEYPNAMLGGMPPKQMLINGQIDKLKSFVDSTLTENYH